MFSYEPSGLEVKGEPLSDRIEAGLPYLCMASARTDIVFSDVAESKTPYPVMKRDASSSYATRYLPAHSWVLYGVPINMPQGIGVLSFVSDPLSFCLFAWLLHRQSVFQHYSMDTVVVYLYAVCLVYV